MSKESLSTSDPEFYIVVIMVLLPMILWYKTFTIYRLYYLEKLKEGVRVNDEPFGEGGGFMSADGFSMRPPLPIEDNTNNENVIAIIKKHNKYVKIFWLWSILGTTSIIVILNLIDK